MVDSLEQCVPSLSFDLDTAVPVNKIQVVTAGKDLPYTQHRFINTDRASYIGFNTSQLLQQLLPFNAIPIQQNMYALTYRKYKFGRGVRYSAGVNVHQNEDEIQWWGLRVDWDRKRNLLGRWDYFCGGGAGIEFFDDPEQVNSFFSPEINVLGQLHWGIEYRLNQVMSLSMECQGLLKLGSNTSVNLRAPTVITAHFRLQ